MDRRKFLNSMSAAAAASIAAAPTLTAKADALEDAMESDIEYRRSRPKPCRIDAPPLYSRDDDRPFLQHNEPALPKMPDNPTLMDFFKLRFSLNHVTQSARLAQKNGSSEAVVLACLLHDTGLNLLSTDHGYWAAQMYAPYVSEEIAWAIENHQALRFFPDPDYDYEYPQAYIEYFGEDYRPEPYLKQAHDAARNHKWYETSRLITINDLYSFDPNVTVDIEDFTDIIGRNFKQPKEGLGFDGTKVAHMWRTMIWPNNFL